MAIQKYRIYAGTGAIAALLLAFAVSPLAAGPLTDAATRAEQLAAAGNPVAAHDTMRAALGDFSASFPFSIGKAVFVKSDPAGYAMYDPRETPVFKAGESLVSYIEPIGLTWKPAGDPAKLQTYFNVDFDILDTKGAVLASQKSFGDFTFTGFFRNQEIYSTLTIDVSGAPAGDYVLRFHFNDLNGTRSASVDQPFTIAAP